MVPSMSSDGNAARMRAGGSPRDAAMATMVPRASPRSWSGKLEPSPAPPLSLLPPPGGRIRAAGSKVRRHVQTPPGSSSKPASGDIAASSSRSRFSRSAIHSDREPTEAMRLSAASSPAYALYASETGIFFTGPTRATLKDPVGAAAGTGVESTAKSVRWLHRQLVSAANTQSSPTKVWRPMSQVQRSGDRPAAAAAVALERRHSGQLAPRYQRKVWKTPSPQEMNSPPIAASVSAPEK
mmetsp:Transcript_5616/g.14242  ORF Transcript_5616/g.14242 Transcript_5616/m.14242 type:complete len:239 (-) Transcript_5616:459-1175(-)